MNWPSLRLLFFFGDVLPGEIPRPHINAGAAIVAGPGLFVVSRERQLSLGRARKNPSG